MNCLICKGILCDKDFDELPEGRIVHFLIRICPDCARHVLVYLNLIEENNQVS